jgi:hypothetical protein
MIERPSAGRARRGAHGFIPKTADGALLLDAVRRVLEGA